jgi:hypothetical protein
MDPFSPSSNSPELFLSYSHKDEALRDKLASHLKVLERQGIIKVWHDRNIDAGSEWKEKIDVHLQSAKIIVLLISADFLASDYCAGIEMNTAMDRHETGSAVVIPVILRPADWKWSRFAKLQIVPKDARPITTFDNRDVAFEQVASAIRNVAESLKQAPTELRTWTTHLEFGMIRLFCPPDQPQESKSWSEIGDGKFHRDFELDADPVFEIMVRNRLTDSVVAYRAGIRMLQRIGGAGGGGCQGCSQPVEVQSEFKIHCPEDWKETWGVINKTTWAEFRDPIEMRKSDTPYRFTLMLENFSDPDSSSACEVRFCLLTDNGTAESRPIWLSQ